MIIDKIKDIFHIHKFKMCFSTGLNIYSECRCGKRKCKSKPCGYQPINRKWLNGGSFA